jgi:hypothetical protein
LYCLSHDLWLLITSWYFFFNTIVLSVPRFTASDYLFGTFSLIPLYYLPRFTASDYLFGTFSLIPLYYLSLDLRLLITSLVPFLLYHCIVCPLIYSFWLPLWYFFFNTIVWSVPRFTASDYLFGTFSLIPFYCLSLDLRLLITSLVLFLWYHCIVCPSMYGFWLPLWYLFFNTIVWYVPRFTASDYLFGTLSLIPLYYLSLD